MPSVQGISDRTGNDWPVGPARGPGLVVSGLGLLGLVAAFANGLPLIVQLPLALAVCALAGHALWRLLQPRIVGFEVDGRQVRLRTASGARLGGDLVGLPFVSPFYVGLRWREEGRLRQRSLGIFREQMNATDFRRLCAILRQRGEP